MVTLVGMALHLVLAPGLAQSMTYQPRIALSAKPRVRLTHEWIPFDDLTSS
jgi:hypothetical protein